MEEQNARAERIGKRCFIVFSIYFLTAVWIAYIGSSRPHLQPAFTSLILGAAITSSLYLRAGQKSYEDLIQNKIIRWHTGIAMAWGIWIMTLAALTALWLAHDGKHSIPMR